MIEKYSGMNVVVMGDGRCDSPGKYVKFCTYSLMDVSSNTIVHSETVDNRERSRTSCPTWNEKRALG